MVGIATGRNCQGPFILVDRLFLVSHIEGITLGAGEEVAGGASGMGVDRIYNSVALMTQI